MFLPCLVNKYLDTFGAQASRGPLACHFHLPFSAQLAVVESNLRHGFPPPKLLSTVVCAEQLPTTYARIVYDAVNL